MPRRNIVKIDPDRCDGCGQCLGACAEGAIQLINGKARLVSDVYCDGLGACLRHCPQGAITVEVREAAGFDEVAVKRHLAASRHPAPPRPAAHSTACACPGSALRQMKPAATPAAAAGEAPAAISALSHWPVQLMLVPAHAPFLQEADLLLCADCVPFTVADFHRRFLAGKAVLVGCPKLDDLDFYGEKLKEILQQARPRSLTVLRMEVPCCGGLAHAAMEARRQVCPQLPGQVVIIGIDGSARATPFEGSGTTEP